jgi:hypothetical protein
MARTPTMASDKRKTNIRFSRAPGFRRVERAGGGSPDPWHSSLWTDSMTRGASEIVPMMVRKRATFDPLHASRSTGDSLPVSSVCPLPPRVVAGILNLLQWRIGLCWQAPRAPQQSGGMGDVARTRIRNQCRLRLIRNAEPCTSNTDTMVLRTRCERSDTRCVIMRRRT